MDDNPNDFTELEAELRALVPSALSGEYLMRVERSLVEPSSLFFSAKNRGLVEWLAWPIAACFVGAMAWLSHGAPRVDGDDTGRIGEGATLAATYKPVDAKNILYDVREEGLTTLADGTPARQVRDRYMDVITWKNAAATSSVCWTVPRDEVRLVPIEAY
jgi:hypothetical protein